MTNVQLLAAIAPLGRESPASVACDFLMDRGMTEDQVRPLRAFPTVLAIEFWIMTNFPSRGNLLAKE